MLRLGGVNAGIRLIGGMSGSSGPPLANLQLWLIADNVLVDPVSLWPDTSGNGNDATQSTASKQPSLISAAFNGHKVVRFDGVDDGMATLLDLASPYSIFLVGLNSSSGGRMIQSGTNNRLIAFNRSNNAVYVGQDVVNSTAIFPGLSAAVGNLIIGSESTWYLNGVDRTDQTNHGNTDWGTVTLNGVGISAEYCACDIAEILIYSSALSDADRQAVEQYLMQKYALS